MTTLHGFTATRTRAIAETGATLHEYIHESSGAHLCWLERADENKTFCAAFRTLPSDDTGVFHILEHSVLCGSHSYPVKEPFVELMKGSMNTFLNAITFPDKTCYPVSSRNNEDFFNLMRVYLDAVFFPRIYEKEEIFRQEGWHYELTDGVLTCNGVVLNEMKGAFAEPDELIANALTRALFPDTPYRFVSGGDPDAIVSLSYADFLAAHRRFYHPSNCYLLLDGQPDLDRALALLDEYLAQFSAIDPDTAIPFQPPVHPEPVRCAYQLPAGEDAAVRMKLGLGYVIGSCQDVTAILAAQILSDVLCGSNHAPLCRAILEGGLAEDVILSCGDDTLQPWLLLQIQNFREEDLPAIRETIRSTLTSLCGGGLDHTQLEASLVSLEFRLRERDFGTMPRGLAFTFDILSSWLYDADPAARLSFGPVFAQLHEMIAQGGFERLLRQMMLENPHMAEVLLMPSETYDAERQARLQEKMAAQLAAMPQARQDEIVRAQQALLAMQQTPDSEQALATIPHIALSDIPREPTVIASELLEDNTLLYHAIRTDGIVYPVFYFDVCDLTAQELPYASLLSAVLAQLPTERCGAAELQKQLRLQMGSFSVSLAPCAHYGSAQDYRLLAAVSCSVLEENLPRAVDLAAQILTQTQFTDRGKLLELVRQLREGAQQQIVSNGSAAAMQRAAAVLSASNACAERLGGVSYYRWLRELEQDFDARADELSGTLRTLAARLFTRARLFVSVTGGSRETAREVLRGIEAALPAGCAPGPAQTVPCLTTRRSGIVIPSEVAFAGVCGDLHTAGSGYCGQMRIACHAASLEHLWNTVRVQGGAYGTGITVRDTGLLTAYSYRDPDSARACRAIAATGAYLREFAASGAPADTYIIGAVSDAEPLLSARLQGAVADLRHFKGLDLSARRKLRAEMLDTDATAIGACAAHMDAALADGAVCVLGPRAQLAACGDLTIEEL